MTPTVLTWYLIHLDAFAENSFNILALILLIIYTQLSDPNSHQYFVSMIPMLPRINLWTQFFILHFRHFQNGILYLDLDCKQPYA